MNFWHACVILSETYSVRLLVRGSVCAVFAFLSISVTDSRVLTMRGSFSIMMIMIFFSSYTIITIVQFLVSDFKIQKRIPSVMNHVT